MRGDITPTLSDSGKFQVAVPVPGDFDFVLTKRGDLWGRFTKFAFHNLCLLHAEMELAAIALIRVPADMVLVALCMGNHENSIWGGIRTQSQDLITVGAAQSVHLRTEGAYRLGAMWLPLREFTRYGSAVSGRVVTVPPGVCRWWTAPDASRRLRHLYSAAIRTARTRLGRVGGVEAAHGLEQQLIHALAECLSTEPTSVATPAMCSAQRLMARFEDLVRSQSEGGLDMSQVRAELGVSDRWLRWCCEQHLGMGPITYIRLHRMQSANKVLQLGDPLTLRVSDVAKRFGFRSLGRFASTYRERYGELPSETLRRGSHRGMPLMSSRSRSARPDRGDPR